MGQQKKKGTGKESEGPMKLFHIFYSQKQWNKWKNSLQEENFGNGPDSEDLTQGLSILSRFNEDICRRSAK